MNKKRILLAASALIILSLACSLFTPSADAPEASATTPAESSATESAPMGIPDDSPCNNVFYPLQLGQQMIYKIDTPDGESQIGLTVSDVSGSQATVDMLDVNTGVTSQSTIVCDNGAITQYPLATLGTVFGDMLDATLNMEHVSGVIAPAEETLVASGWEMSWTSEYIMSGQMTFTQDGETTTITINDSPVTMNWTVVNVGQSLNVPAGNYENVVVVTRQMVTDASMDLGGMVVDSVLTIESTHWFEPYVGMLKMTVDSSTVQMQGISFPIAMGETMELLEIRPAE